MKEKKKREKKEEKEKSNINDRLAKKNTKKERPAKKSEFQRVRQKQLKNRGTHLSFSALFFFGGFLCYFISLVLIFFFSVFSIFFSVFFALNTSHLVETATALQNCHSRRFQYHLFFDPKYHFAVRVREKKKSRIEPSQIESSRIEMNRIKSDMGVVEKGNPAFNTAAGIEAERAAR